MTPSRSLCTLGLVSIAGAILAAAGCGGSSIGGASTGGAGGATGMGGNSAADCAKLTANAQTTPVTVRFVNNTAGDLYIPFPTFAACSGPDVFTITDPSQAKLGYQTDHCNTTCATAICNCVTTWTCGTAALERVAPNGVAVSEWSGGVLESRTVPIACMAGGSCYGPGQETAPCEAYIEPKAYPLTFSADGWTGCSGNACTCTPDASGSCALATYGATADGTTIHGTGSFSKGMTSVDIVFQ